jgi:hypothetical protein
MKAIRRVGLAAVAMVCIGGCGGGSDVGSGDATSSLDSALAEVSTSGEGEVSITWVDTARLREIADLPASSADASADDQRWSLPIGLAEGSALADQVTAVDYGFDPLAGERTIEIGAAPDDATRYDGVDAEGARSGFEDLGFSESGDFLALGDEGELVTEAVDETGAGPIGINRVATEGDALALGAYEAPVAAALGRSGDPLADLDGVQAAADCLGEGAFAAQILDLGDAAGDEVALAAVGLVAPEGDSETVPEVICAVGEPGGSMDRTASCMDDAFNQGGLEPVTAQPYEDLTGKAEIERGDLDGTPWVRAGVEPGADRPVGIVFQLVQHSALPLGGSSPAQPSATAAPPARCPAT